MKILKAAILILISTNAIIQAQETFEEGYFITNEGEVKEVLIKNRDWKNNPVSFVYKVGEEGQQKEQTIEDIHEFGLIGQSKYIRDTIQVDISFDGNNEFSRFTNPIFEEREVFLKVLVEGEASLYQYTFSKGDRFYFKEGDRELEPLIYKRYLASGLRAGENKTYLETFKTLEMYQACIEESGVREPRYKESDLTKYFKKYNSCKGSEYLVYEVKSGKRFYLTPMIGMHYSEVHLGFYKRTVVIDGDQVTNTINSGGGSATGLYAGLAGEVFFRYDRNSWGAIFEAALYSLSYDLESKDTRSDIETFKSNRLDLSIGVRRHFYLSETVNVHLDGMITIPLEIDSYNTRTGGRIEKSNNSSGNYVIGAGIIFSRFNLGIRRNFERKLSHKSIRDDGRMNSISAYVGVGF